MATGHGGARPGAGRRKGSANRLTKELKATLGELAQAYTDEALAALADVMRNGTSEAARVSAANSLLDRGHGKAVQSVELGGPGGGPVETITRRIVDPSAS